MTAPVPGNDSPAVKAPKKTPQANVRVVSRVRPLAKYELEKGCEPVVVRVPKLVPDEGPEALQVNQNDDKRWFELDAVLDESCTQQEVYERSGAYNAIAEDLFSGFNCTILAYGQTGAGKTFTMGTAAKNVAEIDQNDGVIPRAVRDLFENIRIKCDSNAHVELSYMEVYNEEIRDLMNPNPSNQSQLRIRETLNGEVYVRGLQSRSVSNPAEIGKLMQQASERRVVASTKMNAESSRSHAICVLRIKGVLEDSTKFESKLTLVDLAGSERIKKTEAKGSRAQEGININKGLFVLGQVVSALAEQRPKFKRKPPFRDSKLTRLLQDSLGGNSRTIMIACCSPADFNLEETVNTLRYATQARNIKNSATANVVQQISQEEAMKLQRENQLLKQQVSELQETIRKMTAEVTEEDMNRSIALIRSEQRKSVSGTAVGGVVQSQVSPIPTPNMLNRKSLQGKLQPAPELEVPDSSEQDDEDHDDVASDAANDDVDSDEGAANSEAGDEPGPLGGIPKSPPGKKRGAISLDAHFGKQPAPAVEDTHNDDENSLALSEVLPGLKSTDRSVASTKSYQDLEDENEVLHQKLRQAQGDIRATAVQSAIELPALKARVMMLEEELNESAMLEQETFELRQELEEAKADRNSAQLAAKQLAQFMERQKTETGFRGDELEKKRLWYFHKRLDQKWVEFVVTMLASFKEQMRLLGDYFEMVVTVVESPDILTMLGPNARKKNGWWQGFGKREQEERAAGQESELRHRLLGEHIKFFNARLLEIEDEIDNRSENVDAILDGLTRERAEMEEELDETEFVRNLFSKKGEKLLKHLTELMTGPLFSLPLLEGAASRLS
eukprot:Nitzschia sp. Nitz4//scaffold186_size43309//29490//32129//NITZ4_007322-RA/size43309-augustus-gene-0.15-mRNA-1//1//CDS//3329539773//3123//frame0